jgi:uncharacterized protein YkwD
MKASLLRHLAGRHVERSGGAGKPARATVAARREAFAPGWSVVAATGVGLLSALVLSVGAFTGGGQVRTEVASAAASQAGDGAAATLQPSFGPLPELVIPTPPHLPSARTPAPAGKKKKGTGPGVAPTVPDTAPCGTTPAAATLQLINHSRSSAGAPQLTADSGLCAAALLHSQQVAQRSQMTSDGLQDDLRAAGVRSTHTHEILGTSGGLLDPSYVDRVWMQNADQSKAVRDPQYHHVGVAWSRVGDGDWYVSVIFDT